MKESSTNSIDPRAADGLPPGQAERRRFLTWLSVGLGGVCAALVGIPVVGFVLAPLLRKPAGQWRTVGKAADFAIGKTVNVVFEDPSPLPWAGVTARAAAWVRRESDERFIAFSVHCTHLGCPVRWMHDANLFLCPCHGGVYYQDGTVAAGPPPRPLFRYDVRVMNGEVQVKADAIPITTAL
ncbi:(2Fe-2S)-binding protein [Opitutaceae bacterium EW11]|nr:(2Fe-2S)-binding protein [Opitutaceae bacterium EW11]